ncbi:hypothetical protein [Cryobacterium sp. PAMC25264]|uniref:hypothetical protein n=1 Tax=Cryobacterium sp. PAMC25264 TaxID=2861288 RepID=UPI001C62E2A0|nr:hypothetical protein [Cryobacterium sp. PAMC25264]QYF74382.1 hypothetical protein KY500_04015 [Cryobacterium sp. PAMC25264]
MPRAAFAVVFTGVPLGMVAVQFEVPDDIDTMVDSLVAGLLEKRQRSWEENGPASGPMSLADLTPQETLYDDRSSDTEAASKARDEAPDSQVDRVTLDRSGVWVLTTSSGARVLVAVIVEPSTTRPMVTVTRFAAAGYGDQFNGAPLTVAVSDPPEVGMRWSAEVIAVDSKYVAHDRIVYGSHNAMYISTPVTMIQELTYDMLAAATGTPGQSAT